MRQYRGCSNLVFAIETENEDGSITYGAVQTLAPVKSVSRDIASDNETVYADNTAQQITYGATSITRTFDVTRIDPQVAATLLGHTTLTVGESTAILTKADGSKRPFVAIGYALHDGDIDQPVEIVWAYHCKVNSISKTANTIDDGTGSEGQSVEVVNLAPKTPFTKTGERNLDFVLPIDATNAILVDKFFAQVVTPDNAETTLA